MILQKRWMIAWGAVSIFALAEDALAQNNFDDAKDKQKPSAQDGTSLGFANPSKTGTLPPLTTGLAERAARAFGQRKWDDARAAYKEMLQIEPNNALTLANLGTVEQKAGNNAEAKRCYTRAVAINPALAQTWQSLGLLCNEMGDNYLAVSALTHAIYEEPTDAHAHNYLAVVVKKLGWLDAAEAELQRAIELNPAYANAHFNLALMYLDRKPPAIELAKRHYEKAVALGAEKDEIVEEKLKEK